LISADDAGIPEALYRTLRVVLGVRASAPIVDGNIAPAAQPRRVLQLIGIDPFAELGFRGSLAGPGNAELDLTQLLLEPGAAVVTARLAAELGIGVGDTLTVLAGPGEAHIKVIALFDANGQGIGDLDLIVADVATAQVVLARRGALTRIDLTLPTGAAGENLAQKIRAQLPPGVRLETSETRNRATAELADSFKLNLTAMSLLALIVGMFLIYNTMAFSVVQRRELIGRLRAMGVEARQIFLLVLGEALLVGAVGTLTGLVLGTLLGFGLTDLVYRTIDDLYYTVTLRDFHPATSSLVKGIVLGLLGSVVAAWFPAREAAQIPPGSALRRSLLEAKIRRALPRLTVIGVGLLAVGALVLLLPGDALLSGFGGLFVMVLGCALLTPGLVSATGSLLATGLGKPLGLTGRMAARDVGRHLSRTGVAVAALMVALSATVGTGIMVESFRQSVSVWLNALLNADLYVSPVSFVTGDASVALSPAVLERLRRTDGVTGLTTYRHRRLMYDGSLIRLVALDPVPQTRAGYRFVSGDADEAWTHFDAGAVLISESLSTHHHLVIGDSLTLATGSGPKAFKVAAVFTDYGSEHGRLLIRRDYYADFWGDSVVSSAALYSDNPDARVLSSRLLEATSDLQPLRITPSAAIREQSLLVFDRTFVITGVLRILAMIIAFVGILAALMAMLLDRAREFAVLRANGMLPGELGRLVSFHTGILGFAAGLLSIPTGLILAGVLVFVINRRVFGWTMQFQVDASILLQSLLLGVVAALLAGLYPAWRLAHSPPAGALRTD
jgi:putative ABC transport system permease protein